LPFEKCNDGAVKLPSLPSILPLPILSMSEIYLWYFTGCPESSFVCSLSSCNHAELFAKR